ncbi:hypothetical protein HPB49_013448 [Dermacentor silvarum]|uniref:Uncharacterized protein n=1 Tax=Dermacentor silvarum TaxID=543639 RepID=A0ACB8CFG9_DERSI|nr:hypothetical protein HPB49_013448 [Dermacentor silvarum]
MSRKEVTGLGSGTSGDRGRGGSRQPGCQRASAASLPPSPAWAGVQMTTRGFGRSKYSQSLRIRAAASGTLNGRASHGIRTSWPVSPQLCTLSSRNFTNASVKGERIHLTPSEPDSVHFRPFRTFLCNLPRHRRAMPSATRSTPSACATRSCVPRHTCGRRRPVSPPPSKPFAALQAAEMAYQVEGVSITPAELEADSRWIRGVKAHRAAAAHQAIASTPPASPPPKTPTPPPAATPSTTTLCRHAPIPRLPAEDFKIVFRRGGGLDLRTTTNGALLQILCTLATDRTADRVWINPYNSLTVSTPSEPRARLYLRVLELLLGPTSYPLPAYMAAPDNALRGIIYNAVDSQTQDEIVQDLQSMNVNSMNVNPSPPLNLYAIADARQMGRLKSILITFVGTTTLPSFIGFNCGIYRCHPFRPKAEACTICCAPGHCADVCTKPKSTLSHRCRQAHKAVEPPTCVPCCIQCKGAHVTGSRPCKLRFDRNGASSPPATAKPQAPPPALLKARGVSAASGAPCSSTSGTSLPTLSPLC